MSEVKVFKGKLPDLASIRNGEEITLILTEDSSTLIVQASIVRDDITIAVPLKSVALAPQPIVFKHDGKDLQLAFKKGTPLIQPAKGPRR